MATVGAIAVAFALHRLGGRDRAEIVKAGISVANRRLELGHASAAASSRVNNLTANGSAAPSSAPINRASVTNHFNRRCDWRNAMNIPITTEGVTVGLAMDPRSNRLIKQRVHDCVASSFDEQSVYPVGPERQ
jgi:hypothetical protein